MRKGSGFWFSFTLSIGRVLVLLIFFYSSYYYFFSQSVVTPYLSPLWSWDWTKFDVGKNLESKFGFLT